MGTLTVRVALAAALFAGAVVTVTIGWPARTKSPSRTLTVLNTPSRMTAITNVCCGDEATTP